MPPFPASSSRSLLSPSIPPPIASTSSPSTSSLQRPSRKGKERAPIYTPPIYDFDHPRYDEDYQPGFYQPRNGQVKKKRKRKNTEISSDGTGGEVATKRTTKRARKSGLGSEDDGKEKGKMKESKKDVKKTAKPIEIRPPPTSSPPRTTLPPITATQKLKEKVTKKKTKKSVRLDVPATTTDFDDSDGTDPDWNYERRKKRLFTNSVTSDDSNEEEEESRGRGGSTPLKKSRRRLRSQGPLDSSDVQSLPSTYSDSEDEEIDSHYRLNDNEDGDDLLDYSNPLNLPQGNGRRSKKYWRSLEWGVYRSAMNDVARERSNDLARTLVEWEWLTRRRRREEEEEQERVEREVDGQEENEENGIETMRRRGRGRLQELRDGIDSTPVPSGAETVATATSEGGIARPRRRRKPIDQDDDDDEDSETETYPLPSSKELEKIARWPVYPTVLEEYVGSAEISTLEGEFEVVAERVKIKLSRQRAGNLTGGENGRRSTKRSRPARSAYGEGGLFANYRSSRSPSPLSDSSSISSSDDELSDISSSSDSTSSRTARISQIPTTISNVIERLVDFIPKVPLPAQDFWSNKKRTEQMEVMEEEREKERKEEEGKEREREMKRRKAEASEERGEEESTRPTKKVRCRSTGNPGWREVVAVARENKAIPDHVVDKLEAQLKSLYPEESTQEPISLPPIGGEPTFNIAHLGRRPDHLVRKKKRRKASTQVNSPAASGSGEGQQESSTNPETAARATPFSFTNGPSLAHSTAYNASSIIPAFTNTQVNDASSYPITTPHASTSSSMFDPNLDFSNLDFTNNDWSLPTPPPHLLQGTSS